MRKHLRLAESEEKLSVPPWRNRKVLVRIAMGLVAFASVLLIGLFVIYPRVTMWRNDRLLRLAEEYIAKEDYRSSYLLLDQFVHTNPANFTARRMLAHTYEVIQPDQAIIEWENLTMAEAGNPANFVGYATAALRVGQPDRLPPVLAALEKLEPESVEYHRLAAASALARGEVAKLREHVEQLTRLEPQNPHTRFSLAALQLNSARPAELEQARASMREMAQGDGLRIRATLALINDAPRRWPEEIPARLYARLADELGLRGIGTAEAPRYVSIQDFALPPPGLPALIGHMEAQPTLTAGDAVMLAQWMLRTGQASDALYWLDTLAEPLRTSGEVRQWMATCAAALGSWPRLEQLVAGGAWGPVPTESVKQAFIAHALRAAKNESKAASQWSSAIRLAEQSLAGLRALQRLAQIWRWPDKQVQVLWVLVRQFPADELAWRALAQHAQAGENSAELWRIHQAWAQAVPSNAGVRAEQVLVGLLIRPDETGLGSRAAELFTQYPGIPACRVAQALSLWRARRAAEALELLEAEGHRLNFGRNPRFALVNGLVLAALGRTAESEKMFALVQNAKPLPEERALMAQARKPGR